MAPRKRRWLVGSLSSLVWPAVVVLIPAGITFAAARVYAEGAAPPPKCDQASVTTCAGKTPFAQCASGFYGGGPGVCFASQCVDGGDSGAALNCLDVQFCKDVSDQDCRSRTLNADCNDAGGTCKSVTGMMGEPQSACYELDAGIGVESVLLKCVPKDGGPSGASSSSSGDNGGTSGSTYVPGPDKVPGSSSSSGSTDDSGCSTTSSNTSTLPLIAAPLAIGLLFALRKKRKRAS